MFAMEGVMNWFDRLLPHLILVAALLPTLLVITAAALSLAPAL